MQESIFYQLSILLVLTTLVGVVFRALKQPLILSYIFTGFLVGPAVLGFVHHSEAFESFSQMGIVLLLFIVGSGLDTAVIKKTGKPVLLSFFVKSIGLGVVGFLVSRLFGLGLTESLIMAIALSFCSTIIVVKALSDERGQARLYGQIAIGILLAEDLLATVALVFVSAGSESSASLSSLLLLLAKAAGLAAGLTLAGVYVLPRLAKVVAVSQEMLYIAGLAWGFGVATVFWWAGFSIEVGALFAGVAVAHMPYAQAISSRLKPLRDFFIVLFFISLGQGLEVSNLSSAVVPALVLSFFVMVLKPLLTMISLGVLGYTKQTGFKTAIHLSQISEFSIILVVLAQSTGMVSGKVTAIITLTALITIGLSTYLMHFGDVIYRKLQKSLSIFERSDLKKELLELRHYPLVLIGYRESAHEYINAFKRAKKPYAVIDFSPQVINILAKNKINHSFGDATDPELLDELGLQKSELVISSLTDPRINKLLLSLIMQRNCNAVFICHAASYDEADALYKGGATYVIMPHFIGTEHVSELIRKNGSSRKAFDRHRDDHISRLKDLSALRASHRPDTPKLPEN